MPVPVRAAAQAKDFPILLVAPFLPRVAVRRREAYSPGEKRLRHGAKVGMCLRRVQTGGAKLAPRRCVGELVERVKQPARGRRLMEALSIMAASRASSPVTTILVAEDHLDSRDALRTLLEAFGYHVLEAVNGREAVELAIEQHPDLILMDIMMPEIDGFEATRQLRRHSETAGTPIIAVNAMEGAQQLAMQAGANDYVRKPVDIRRLVAKVHDLLDTPAPRL